MAALLYHAGALGDFVTTLPAIRFWKSRRPGEGLVMLGGRTTGEFAKDVGLVDAAFDVDAARFLPLFTQGASSEAARLLAPFTEAIVFSHSASPLIGHLRRAGKISLSWQPPFPAARRHVVDYHLSLFADPATLAAHEKIPRVAPPSGAMSAARAIIPFDKRFMALHPGSGSAKRTGPSSGFMPLPMRCDSAGFPFSGCAAPPTPRSPSRKATSWFRLRPYRSAPPCSPVAAPSSATTAAFPICLPPPGARPWPFSAPRTPPSGLPGRQGPGYVQPSPLLPLPPDADSPGGVRPGLPSRPSPRGNTFGSRRNASRRPTVKSGLFNRTSMEHGARFYASGEQRQGPQDAPNGFETV